MISKSERIERLKNKSAKREESIRELIDKFLTQTTTDASTAIQKKTEAKDECPLLQISVEWL